MKTDAEADDEFIVAFEAAMTEFLETFKSMADKVMKKDPTWAALPVVLTAEEMAVFDAFAAWRLGR